MPPISFLIALSCVLAAPAVAHTVAGPGNSFAAGIAHPLGGADHLAAIVFAGLWSVLVGRVAMIMWPATFMLAMLGGFAVASTGLQIGFVEVVISLSVILLGVFIAVELKMPVLLGTAIIGQFAFFHGHAHGTEATSMRLPYVAGFMTATAALLAIGIVAGIWARNFTGRLMVRTAAGCSALLAAFLLWGGS